MSKKKGRTISKIEKKHIIASAIVVTLAVMFVFALSFLNEKLFFAESIDEASTEMVQDGIVRHALTGSWMYEEGEELPQVFGVMIENHIDARPQAGLDQAFLVIEAPVEAGISRMLAFYSEDQEVEKIGPVRSARPYYVDWAHELDALYVHVGGSPDALDQIATDGTFDLNQYWYDEYFWRSYDREAPHNVYTSTESLNEAIGYYEDRDRAPNLLYGVWKFKDAATEVPDETVGVTIDFSVYDWNLVSWEFDVELMRYVRSQAGYPHEMEDDVQVQADNVAIVMAEIDVIDSIGRRSIETVGEGEAYVLQDGLLIEATWKKESVSERLRFYDADDEEIEMNAGVTWIEVAEEEDVIINE